MSWSWGYTVGDVVGALRDWADQSHADVRRTFIWVCFFCLNQFRMMDQQASGGAADLDTVFRERLRNAGTMIALLDSWARPRYFRRVWCVYEQFIAHELGVQVEVIFPPAVASDLRSTLQSDFLTVRAALTDIDVEKAEASNPSDTKTVKAAIQNTEGGFDGVNTVVRERFAEWCAQELTRHSKGELEEMSAASMRRNSEKDMKEEIID